MNHIKILSAAAFVFLLCSGLEAAQSELPCGVSVVFDYKVASTNSVKTGHAGFLGIGKYRSFTQTWTDVGHAKWDEDGFDHGTFDQTVTETYPHHHHYGAGNCPSVGPESQTENATVTYTATLAPTNNCMATSTNNVWNDANSCHNKYSIFANSMWNYTGSWTNYENHTNTVWRTTTHGRDRPAVFMKDGLLAAIR